MSQQRILTINEYKKFLELNAILEGKKSNEEKLARYKQQLANWDEAHESELAKKRKGSSLKKKERLRKRILALQKKMKREATPES